MHPTIQIIINNTFDYEAGYRAGGGISIAAPAIASTYGVCGDFDNKIYLKTAEDAFAFLEKYNIKFAPDGKENILDDYCALLAAVELYKATKKGIYKKERISHEPGRGFFTFSIMSPQNKSPAFVNIPTDPFE